MNIQLLAPNSLKQQNKDPNSTVSRSYLYGMNEISSYPNLRPLTKDTVAFGQASSKLSDFVTKAFSKETERMQRIATIYLDSLESVALRLKDHGFSFDRVYCEQNPVKSAEAAVSKVIRSKNFNVPDRIRATVYCNSAYDMDSLSVLLAEMKKRGYVLADTEMSVTDLMKRGYIPTAEELAKKSANVKVKDIDLRLDDSLVDTSKLPMELKYALGKPQKSGYEDIQMRFVRDFDKSSNPVQHELIVLFGPNYSQAKHLESEKVYSHLRKFDELNMKFEDKTIGSNHHKANRYVDLIQQMFRGKISQKLYLNAKNKDLYDLVEEVPITFSEIDTGMLKNYFNGLRARTSKCYSEAKANCSNAISSRQFTNEQRHDTKIINEIQKGLDNTIEYFNSINATAKQ